MSRPRPVLLDTSFLIDLERETAKRELGPARRFLASLRGRPLVLSIVTIEELLEGAADEAAALASLQRFSIEGLHLAQARRCARRQRRATRRMGENDAWLVATAESINARITSDFGTFLWRAQRVRRAARFLSSFTVIVGMVIPTYYHLVSCRFCDASLAVV